MGETIKPEHTPASLARFFRAAAAETQDITYKRKLLVTARELEARAAAEHATTQCSQADGKTDDAPPNAAIMFGTNPLTQ